MKNKLQSFLKYIKLFKNWPVPAFSRYFGKRFSPFHIVEFRDGRKIAFRPFSDSIALGEIFVVEGYHQCKAIKRKVDIVWDIGGNIGGFVVWASQLFPKAKFTSFEPCKDTFAVLVKTKNLNPSIDWQVHDFGLSSIDEEVVARVPSLHYGEASRYASEGEEVRFKLKRFQEVWICLGSPFIDLLKVDCEGGEHEIFRDLQPILADKIGNIIMEVHSTPGYQSTEIQQILIEAGFEVQWYEGQQGVAFASNPRFSVS